MAKKTIYDAVVIGAGASGLMAAVTAARLGAAVVLLEHMEQPAKKILATGNGKCNYTNADQNLENYYCEQPDFIRTVLAQFSYKDTIRFFNQLGIRPVEKNGTCMYPESEQASSVRNVLLAEVRRLQIPLFLSVGIRSIHKLQNNNGTKNRGRQVFEIQAKDGTFYAHACILATGGMAAKKTGSDGSGYVYEHSLGNYGELTLTDFNGDGANELFIIDKSLPPEEEGAEPISAQARLFTFEEGAPLEAAAAEAPAEGEAAAE